VAGSWEGEEERVAAERFRQANVHANLGRALGTEGRLQANSRYAAWEGDDYPDASGGPLFGSGLLRTSEHREASLALDLEWRRQRLSAAFYRHERDVTGPAVGQQVPASREDTAFQVARLGWSSVLHGSERLQVSLGADVREERGDNESALLLPPVAGGEVPGDYAFSRTLGGAYLELVAQRGGWTVELGSRLDLPEGHGAEWSPRLGASFQSGATTLRGSLGRAWKLPSFFALASPPQLGGNPDLRPETVWGGDLGVGWKSGPCGLDLTLFYNRYDDLIDFDFATFRHVNRSEVEARGAELAAAWHARDGLTVRADAGWQRVEDRATGLGLRHRPEWTGSLRLDWQATDRLALRLDARAVDRRLDQQIPVPERQSVAGYAIAGLGGAFRLADRWQLDARIDNAADTSYQELIGFPGPGRSARLTLRHSFHPGEP
jgi:outer membrane cobalamin receptor